MSEIATFAAGCFWGVEEAFLKSGKVLSTCVGYTGGKETFPNPSYRQVCTGETGHAEAVQVHYDETKTTFRDLLNIFWTCHDPTQLNRQGPDVGTQYRSVIFYHDQHQQQEAENSKQRHQKLLGTTTIVTTIEPARPFYPAEDYHQQYLRKNNIAYCHL